MTPGEVLSWWFGEPARSDADLQRKVERWFRDGRLLDQEVRERFGATIERALAGELDTWVDQPRGRLALIIVLDQLTRHAYRGDPRAHAGDAEAQALCLDGLAQGDAAHLSLEESAFFLMPLVHAEDLALQDRAVALRVEALDHAPEAMRRFAEIGLRRAREHRDVIRQFGRFPHRNATLGRSSTVAEQRWLQSEPAAAAAVIRSIKAQDLLLR